ncbi:hypothetical protein AZH53_05220 [Methanomicrobiaceae archaeon CYW5]|uniref:ATP-binding cassette domain-containing protein n=1 Tax=Methanovulcanius yangii TaxID=1789227 RepID=UPI0029C9BA7F|nr:ATP-binding cassette domain-containing protein [Methanovulcanius yangii]MBT8507818.1 hypothetical protein [Methanovulcanius yangii]
MQLILDGVTLARKNWKLSAEGAFQEGIHLISGRVGSGKSSLAQAIAGMMAPTSGSILFRDIERHTLSMQFPEYHTTGHLVRDEIRSWGLEPERICMEAGLQGREYERSFALSRGELKRLHMSCILAGKRDLLILDEPFSTLDPEWKRRICRKLYSHHPPITLIFTHEQAVLPRVDYLWEIHEGHLHNRGKVPEAIPSWRGAPRYIEEALRRGVVPENITVEDTQEALCRMHD